MKEAKKTKTHSTFDAIHEKVKSKPLQFFSKFFVLICKLFCMFRGFEQLYNSIGWQVMTCSTWGNPDTWRLLINSCAPFLHHSLSEDNHCCKPVWRSDKFPLWLESDICIRFSVNKECTWMQKVYNTIMCVTNLIRLLMFVVGLEMRHQRWWRNHLLNRTFSIGSQSTNYRIKFARYLGNAGDAMGGSGNFNLNNQSFSTADRDNDG